MALQMCGGVTRGLGLRVSASALVASLAGLPAFASALGLLLAGPVPAAAATETETAAPATPAGIVWLDELPQDEIVDPFGPPNRRRSFGESGLAVAGKRFERGLGTHAPSRLDVELPCGASRFEAVVGVDEEVQAYANRATRTTSSVFPSYVYDSRSTLHDFRSAGTVRFLVLADGREAFDSGPMDRTAQGRSVSVDLVGVRRLSLVVEDGGDGSFGDHADWAEARIAMKDAACGSRLRLAGRPEGILVSHVGFLPGAAKSCVVAGDAGGDFQVREATGGAVAFRGALARVESDWGVYGVGDFSALVEPGRFVIESGLRRSGEFEIGEDLHDRALSLHLSALTAQRSGDPEHGWTRGAHQDDGVRRDNGQHQDVSGGWYDAADLRKWGYTMIDLWALARLTEERLERRKGASGTADALTARLIDEARWGNRYFLTMQEPQGYVMSHIGGDVFEHADSNYFTDNVTGTWDDRIIETSPNDPVFQLQFAEAEARLSRLLAAADPAYSGRCREAAGRAWAWATANGIAKGAEELGAAVSAALVVEQVALAPAGTADGFAERLLMLQTQGAGWFRSSPTDAEPARDALSGSRPLIALSDLLEARKASGRGGAAKGWPLQPKAEASLRLLAESHHLALSRRSAFGLVPFGVFSKDPGGSRQVGTHFYRWCMPNFAQREWWNGSNPHFAGTGYGLALASRALREPELRRLAQRQLDWIYGANPFDASTVSGLGRNQPSIFRTVEWYSPPTPEIPGAVMAGIGTTADDRPLLAPGWWQTAEYWSPALTHTMLLLGALER